MTPEQTDELERLINANLRETFEIEQHALADDIESAQTCLIQVQTNCARIEEILLNVATTHRDNVTARDGLLWRRGNYIPLPEADRIARQNGFGCAEQMVRHLEAQS